MKIYEELLDENEEILWIKEFPQKNISAPERKKLIHQRNKDLSILIAGSLTCLTLIIILIISIAFSSKMPLVLGIIGIGGVILGLYVCVAIGRDTLKEFKIDWENKQKRYQEYLKYYTEEDLRNHSEYNIITNKKILINQKHNIERGNKKITEIKNVIELNKDFLIININYLSKVRFNPNLNRLYFKLKLLKKFRALLNAEKYHHTEKAMSFFKISDDEYSEILKILFNLVPHLKIETESLYYPDDDDFLIG